jgi:hypothetical protein
MANIITTSDFKGLFQLSTGNASVTVFVTDIITQVEAMVLSKLTYDLDIEEEVNDIKAMLIRFVYALYQGKQTKVNTQKGNVQLNSLNAEVVLLNEEAYSYYNEAVAIFNEYVTDIEDEMSYINRFGI